MNKKVYIYAKLLDNVIIKMSILIIHYYPFIINLLDNIFLLIFFYISFIDIRFFFFFFKLFF